MMATAIVVAAGSGERLGAGEPKALVELAGRPMVAWPVRALDAAREVDALVVAAPEGYEARIEVLVLEAAPQLRTTIVTGGESRSESVANALSEVRGPIVLVHDAARPLLTPELVDSCVAELGRCACDAVVAGVRVADTIKRADSARRVSETLDRNSLWAIQTPQVFKRESLERAIEAASDLSAVTDDASLVELSGGVVNVVESPHANIKVTTPEDLRVAEALLADAD